jgi:guanosine-3',5'-bis(diphosphate) 3'-pyrophosphohydrolase
MTNEAEARAFAIERHREQRYGDAPYLVHLEAVRGVLHAFDHDDGPLAIAAWLHDTVEDTPTTRDEIESRFGRQVAELVWAVTGVGENRKQRNADAYAKIRAHPRAAILKLADRIANVEASKSRPDKLAMYKSELASFEAALDGLGDPKMWERLRRALAG